MWGLVWIFLTFVGEILLWYAQNNDVISLNEILYAISFVGVFVAAGVLTIGIKKIIKDLSNPV